MWDFVFFLLTLNFQTCSNRYGCYLLSPLYYDFWHYTSNCVAKLPTVSPQILYDPCIAKLEVPPPLVENPFSDAKVEVAPKIQNLSIIAKAEVPPPIVEKPSSVVKVDVAPQAENPSVNAKAECHFRLLSILLIIG